MSLWKHSVYSLLLLLLQYIRQAEIENVSLRPGQLLEVYTAFAVSGHTEHLKEVGACPAVRWLFVHVLLKKGVYPKVYSVVYCLIKTSVPFNLFVCFDIFNWLQWKKSKLQSKIRISNLCSSIEILKCASLCLNQFSTFQQEMACAMETHRMYTSNSSKTFKLMVVSTPKWKQKDAEWCLAVRAEIWFIPSAP